MQKKCRNTYHLFHNRCPLQSLLIDFSSKIAIKFVAPNIHSKCTKFVDFLCLNWAILHQIHWFFAFYRTKKSHCWALTHNYVNEHSAEFENNCCLKLPHFDENPLNEYHYVFTRSMSHCLHWKEIEIEIHCIKIFKIHKSISICLFLKC